MLMLMPNVTGSTLNFCTTVETEQSETTQFLYIEIVFKDAELL